MSVAGAAASRVAIRHFAFLTPGNYGDDDPAAGLESALRLFALAEELGFDSAWVRQRHLERGVSSAPAFLAAASQRTRRIGLGTAVIQLGYENLFRLAEDLATVDLLSRGRLQVGVSAGAAPHGPLLGSRLFDAAPAQADLSYPRVLRLRDNLEGQWLSDEPVIESATGAQRARIRPYAAGLAQRLWYGAGSLASAQWAGASGLHLLLGNVTRGETGGQAFLAAQGRQLDTYLAAWDHAGRPGSPRVALGRVIVPTDSASAAARRRYEAWAASRIERTRTPQGPRGTMYLPDLVGPSERIVEQLHADPLLPRVSELRLELPYDLDFKDYAQILGDAVRWIAPALGWLPTPAVGRPSALPG
jgi:alkanesulfonate monooxygenase SsuD/methylene tetrahydromethanopterin reductase-like flavin-dependent oxidoreductase (luciferase family)